MERDQAIRFVHDLLRLLLNKKGSDLFLTAEFPPAFKIDGLVTAGDARQAVADLVTAGSHPATPNTSR